MEIVVCVKQVPDSQDLKINPATNTLDRSGASLILNPADASALEAARTLKKTAGGSMRTISMGPKSAEAALLQTAKKGADRLILATDPAFAGGDTFATATVLREAIEATGAFDLILCGRRAIDGETGQVGGELAALLGIPCLTNVVELRLDDDALICARLTENGEETLAVSLPALITMCESYQERLPSLSEIRRAAGMKVEFLDSRALGFEKGSSRVGLNGSKTRVRRIFTPAKNARHGTVTDDPACAVQTTMTKISEAVNNAQ